MSFQGAAALSLDAKGRLAIPARHRDALMSQCGGNLVLTAHPHGCLLVYPRPAWEPIRDQILAAPGLDRGAAALKRLLVGNARDEEMDAAGRVLVAPELRGFAKLDKQVRLVGQGRCFELWSEEAWNTQQDEAAALFASGALPAGFENLSL
ncbi:division/cell wall cluster transcriptional repressor MraZ [Uliginosibacterium sp. 31-16]|uniref:division/cell wall cluster transcriptional repressor MraZ n=1 Tax=Uliginosibacterium sp. 31-16 TaxID=3068315 RepID=UPI00273F588E|nr:division/cell wall cluster transcriptional repressor MraZ [Uliginosibacterium sp. 31-16]MDP5237953.1 division/cell wall cluster transcriptional repressor MraZ [Uliginosibacterium sp. 31-16]